MPGRLAYGSAGRNTYTSPQAYPILGIVALRSYHQLTTNCSARCRARLSCLANGTTGEPSDASISVQTSDNVLPAALEAHVEPPGVATNALESLDDMAAFVERTRLEEESIRRRREEVELQLLRMRQQEAVRRQQAIKLRLATDRANAAVLRGQAEAAAAAGQNHRPHETAAVPATYGSMDDISPRDDLAAATAAAAPSPSSSSSSSSSLPAAVAATAAVGATGVAASAPGAPTGPLGSSAPKKKLVLKKSKRMTAVAAAAGLHRVSTPPAAPTSGTSGRMGVPVVGYGNRTGSGGGSSSAGQSQGGGSGVLGGGGVGKALLSREELIEKRKEVEAGGTSPGGACDSGDDGCGFDEVVVPKPIFIISDCTGESAARTVRAALNQFEMRCRTQAPAQIMIYRFVESADKMMSIINEAAKEDALVVYTLVDPKAVKVVQTACKLQKVRYVDLWTALLDTMEVHLNAVRSGVPASLAETRKPTASLTDEYFRMIEAVEYTRKMDDGAHPQEWVNADLVILGVSRCGKTPLSIYLGQRGYKVANLPLIPGCPVPRELYDIDQTRIVGLIIDPNVLATIRRNRVNIMGVSRAQAIDYAEVKKINSELDWARKLYNSNPEWPVIDVTLRGIEETAARILKMLNDRRGDASPKWVEAYHAKHQQQQQHQQGGPLSPGEGAPYNIPEMIYGAHESNYLMQGLY